jgi:hypothetical protein
MVSPHRFLTLAGAALAALHLGIAASHAADGNLGQPKELINQPVCWTAEEPDFSRHCDFAQRP